MKLFLLQFCLDLNSDLFLDSSFVHAVAGNLRKQFHVSVGALYESTFIKLLAEVYVFMLVALGLRVFLPEIPNTGFSFADPPLFNPARDQQLVPVNLNK